MRTVITSSNALDTLCLIMSTHFATMC